MTQNHMILQNKILRLLTFSSEDQYTHLMKILKSQNLESDVAAVSHSTFSSTQESSVNVARTCILSRSNSKWMVDSGATDHICSNIESFDSLQEFKQYPNTITIADRKQVVW